MAIMLDLIKSPSLILQYLSDIREGMRVFRAYADLMANLARCHFEKTFDKIMSHCAYFDEQCTSPHMFENFAKHHMDLFNAGGETIQGLYDGTHPNGLWPANEAHKFES